MYLTVMVRPTYLVSIIEVARIVILRENDRSPAFLADCNCISTTHTAKCSSSE